MNVRTVCGNGWFMQYGPVKHWVLCKLISHPPTKVDCVRYWFHARLISLLQYNRWWNFLTIARGEEAKFTFSRLTNFKKVTQNKNMTRTWFPNPKQTLGSAKFASSSNHCRGDYGMPSCGRTQWLKLGLPDHLKFFQGHFFQGTVSGVQRSGDARDDCLIVCPPKKL